MPWSLEDWAQEDKRLRRAHADATLAHSAALVAGPLLTSPDLRVGLPPSVTHFVTEQLRCHMILPLANTLLPASHAYHLHVKNV